MKKETINNLVYKDNPNLLAKVGFVIFYPFQFYVYKDVYKSMEQESEFIVDMGTFFPTDQPQELLDDIYKLLKNKGVHFRILHFTDYYSGTYLESFFKKYQTLVSVWNRGCYRLSCNKEKKTVCMQYGAGKDLATFALWRKDFDLVLAYGERDHAILSLMTSSKIVGNPKFDDWFNSNFDHGLIDKIQTKLDKSKKTVLYLPTHSDLCSIDDLAEELKLLTDSYNIITKLHYYAAREEPEKTARLEHEKMIVLNDDADLLSLLKISDVVVSDNSSAIFDAILADKPITTTDFIPKSYLENEHKAFKETRRGPITALTYTGSIEQEIKKEGLILSFKRPSDLRKSVEEALQDSQFLKDSRKKLREHLFSFNDGRCGQRAAEEIIALMDSTEKKEKPLFFHLVDTYVRYGHFFLGINSDFNSQFQKEIDTYHKIASWRKFAAYKFLKGVARQISIRGQFGKKADSSTFFLPLKRMMLYKLLGGKGIGSAFIIFSGTFFVWLGEIYVRIRKYEERLKK